MDYFHLVQSKVLITTKWDPGFCRVYPRRFLIRHLQLAAGLQIFRNDPAVSNYLKELLYLIRSMNVNRVAEEKQSANFNGINPIPHGAKKFTNRILAISEPITTTFQFAKSQQFSNVRVLQIFERKVLLSVLNSRTILERDFVRQIASQNCNAKTLGFLRLV